MDIWRTLSPEEEASFREWARDTYTPNTPVNPLWHPVVREECERMNTAQGWPHDATPEELHAEAHADDPPHYHVVAFINGCLNDYDSGPYDTIEDAREGLRWYIDAYNGDPADDSTDTTYPVPAGRDRYEHGLYIIKIEECTESPCEIEG